MTIWVGTGLLGNSFLASSPPTTQALQSPRLRNKRPSLMGTPLSPIPSSWADIFWKNVEHKKVPRTLVARATAALDFDLTRGRPAALRRSLVEYPFACRLHIEDDRGRAYTWTTEAWCFPHDPAVELKS